MALRGPKGEEFESRAALREHMREHFTFVGRRDEALRKGPGEVDGQAFELASLVGCDVRLADRCGQVTADELLNCRVLIGPTESTVFLRGCRDCHLTIACKQLRLRDCSNVIVRLYSATDPVIETSRDVFVGPYNGSYPLQDSHFAEAGLDPQDNHWRNVYDFNAEGEGETSHWEAIDAAQWQNDDGSPTPAALTCLEAAFDRFDYDNDSAWSFEEFNAYQAATGAGDEVVDSPDMLAAMLGEGGIQLPEDGKMRLHTVVQLYTLVGGLDVAMGHLGIDYVGAVWEVMPEGAASADSMMPVNPVPFAAAAKTVSDRGHAHEGPTKGPAGPGAAAQAQVTATTAATGAGAGGHDSGPARMEAARGGVESSAAPADADALAASAELDSSVLSIDLLQRLRVAFDRFDQDKDQAWNYQEFNAFQVATGNADEVLDDGEQLEQVMSSADVPLDARQCMPFQSVVKLFDLVGADALAEALDALGVPSGSGRVPVSPAVAALVSQATAAGIDVERWMARFDVDARGALDYPSMTKALSSMLLLIESAAVDEDRKVLYEPLADPAVLAEEIRALDPSCVEVIPIPAFLDAVAAVSGTDLDTTAREADTLEAVAVSGGQLQLTDAENDLEQFEKARKLTAAKVRQLEDSLQKAMKQSDLYTRLRKALGIPMGTQATGPPRPRPGAAAQAKPPRDDSGAGDGDSAAMADAEEDAAVEERLERALAGKFDDDDASPSSAGALDADEGAADGAVSDKDDDSEAGEGDDAVVVPIPTVSAQAFYDGLRAIGLQCMQSVATVLLLKIAGETELPADPAQFAAARDAVASYLLRMRPYGTGHTADEWLRMKASEKRARRLQLEASLQGVLAGDPKASVPDDCISDLLGRFDVVPDWAAKDEAKAMTQEWLDHGSGRRQLHTRTNELVREDPSLSRARATALARKELRVAKTESLVEEIQTKPEVSERLFRAFVTARERHGESASFEDWLRDRAARRRKNSNKVKRWRANKHKEAVDAAAADKQVAPIQVLEAELNSLVDASSREGLTVHKAIAKLRQKRVSSPGGAAGAGKQGRGPVLVSRKEFREAMSDVMKTLAADSRSTVATKAQYLLDAQELARSEMRRQLATEEGEAALDGHIERLNDAWREKWLRKHGGEGEDGEPPEVPPPPGDEIEEAARRAFLKDCYEKIVSDSVGFAEVADVEAQASTMAGDEHAEHTQAFKDWKKSKAKQLRKARRASRRKAKEDKAAEDKRKEDARKAFARWDKAQKKGRYFSKKLNGKRIRKPPTVIIEGRPAWRALHASDDER